jgi:pimeloyl-ACP methyl ester carboxylesterase
MKLITLLLGLIVFTFNIKANFNTSINNDTATGSCLVTKVIGEGQAVLLMPGFISDETVWEAVAQSLSSEYQVHQLAIAGFGKNPACDKSNDIFAQVQLEITAYLNQNQLTRPIFVGHSMGGLMAFKLALDTDNGLAGAISVDGLPFIGPVFTRTNKTKVVDIQNQASGLKTMYQNATTKELTMMTKQGIMIQTKLQNKHQDILSMAENSDPVTAGSAIYSVMTTDLRADLKHLKTPMLLLGASGGFYNVKQQKAAQRLYQGQLTETLNVDLKMNTSGRHFLMWDEPKWLQKTIIQFAKERS